MKKQAPLVSICIPTYNGEAFLAEAIDSAINQTYRPLEIVISDDASKDNTKAIIKEKHNETDIPLTLFNHKPSGIGANWNNCVKNSKGEFIKFLFQDDLLNENCIEEMMQFQINSEEELGLIFSDRTIFGEIDSLGLKNYQYFNYEPIFNGYDILKRKDLYHHPRNKIGEPITTLIPTKVLKQVGLFNEQLEQSLDYEMWYRICHHYKIGYIDKELVKFRIHKNQTTQNNIKKVTKDRYLLPLLLLKKHWTVLNARVLVLLLYKLLSGGSWYFFRKKVIL